MANKKITDLTASAVLNDTDLMWKDTAGSAISHKITGANLKSIFLQNVGFADFDTDVSDTMAFSNGAALDSPAVTVTSNGTTITTNVEKSGGGDIRIVFSTGVYTWATSPADTVPLTAGSDISPQINYVYFLESTKTLTASTVDFPTAEHMPVATVLCQSALTLQSDGAYKAHSWTDHMASTDNMGHLAHLNHWIRNQAATWNSGVALTPAITTQPAAEDNVDISTSSGSVLQLHDHSFPAFDTAVTSDVYIVNDPSIAYTKITDLGAADQTSGGATIGNNQRTNLVIWGVVSEATGDCKLMLNLPSGFYTSDSAATLDASAYSNYTIPAEYTGVGFLIARLTLRYTTTNSGTWVLVENLDLRQSGAVGGSSAGTNEFIDNVFRIQNVTDVTKEIDFDASAITTGTTRTVTMPDSDVTLVANAITASSTDTLTNKIFTADGQVAAPALAGSSDTSTGWWFNGSKVNCSISGTSYLNLGAALNVGLRLHSDISLGWTSGAADSAAPDLQLFRDAAYTLGQRSFGNSQTYRVYNTYTDASNYERLSISGDGSITVETAGTGTDNIDLNLVPAGTGSVTADGVDIVTISSTDTLTNKRITLRTGTAASSASLTIASDDVDRYTVTALAEAMTINAPSGTPTDGQTLLIRIKDNATGRALTWNAIFRVVGTTLPTTTVASKTMYVGCMYNTAETKWDVTAVAEEV